MSSRNDLRTMSAADLIANTEFKTLAAHLEESRRAGNFIQFSDPSEEELAALIVPHTYCPNVAEILDESNWACLAAALTEASPDGADYERHDFGHWATPYAFYTVRPGSEAHRAAEQAVASLADYPVLDESDYSERETAAFEADLKRALARLTIEVNGVEVEAPADGEQFTGAYGALFDAIASALCESESRDNCDKSDVEAVLEGLGFEYNEDDMTWRGTLEINPEPTAIAHSYDRAVFCEVCCAPGAGCSFSDTERAPAPDLEECWGYGSGMPGCMFDNGPHVVRGTKDDAIDAALFPFHGTWNETDLTDAELEAARNDLRADGIHYFPSERRCELGVSLVQVWEADPADLEDMAD